MEEAGKEWVCPHCKKAKKEKAREVIIKLININSID